VGLNPFIAKIPPNNIMINSINPVYNIALKDKLYIFYEILVKTKGLIL
jgi:hypothetical protein